MKLGLIFLVSLGLWSCDTCVECTHKSLKSVTVCEKDAGSNDNYNKTVHSLETVGYTCSEK